MSSSRLRLLLVFAMVAGCSDGGDGDAPELPEASLPGVYAGVFPCEGCPGIASTLWLRPDYSYFFRQQYAADDALEATEAYSLGRWSLVTGARAIELSGAGPRRVFAVRGDDELLMRTDSDLEHRLTRDPTAAAFAAPIRLTGLMRVRGNSVSFTECLTGLAAPVSKNGEFARFQHQYRSVGRSSEPTFVEFEGRFSWADDGAPKLITIERFITVKENGTC